MRMCTPQLALTWAAKGREQFTPAAVSTGSDQKPDFQTLFSSNRIRENCSLPWLGQEKKKKDKRNLEQFLLESSRNDGSWQSRPSNQLEQVSTGQNGKNSIAKVNSGSFRAVALGIHEAAQTLVSCPRAWGEVVPQTKDTQPSVGFQVFIYGAPFPMSRVERT